MIKHTLTLAIGLLILLMIPVSAAVYEKGTALNYVVSCNDLENPYTICDAQLWNISIFYPNSTLFVSNAQMSVNQNYANYSFVPPIEGTYKTFLFSNTSYYYSDEVIVTSAGMELTEGSAILNIGYMAIFIMALFWLAQSFSERWKIKMFFHVCAMLVCVVLINSSYLMTLNNELHTNTLAVFIMAIAITSFLFVYMLILYTIEIFKSFNRRRTDRWKEEV